MEDLILKAYRDKERKSTINVDIKSHVYGFEIYRIALMLLDKLMHLSQDVEYNEENINTFFEEMKKDYKKYYLK